MAVIAPEDTLFAEDRAAWREWLAAHHQDRTLVWLLLHKKHVQEPSVRYDEAVEEALCWGWIDGLTNSWDERSYALRFTPRRPGSVWSESNVARVERLIADGRMTPAGMALVDEAKRRGTWDHAASGRFDVTPPDLEAALAGVPAAAARWLEWPGRRGASTSTGCWTPSGRRRGRGASPTSCVARPPASGRARRAERGRRRCVRGPVTRGARARRRPAAAAPRRPVPAGRRRTSGRARPAAGSRR